MSVLPHMDSPTERVRKEIVQTGRAFGLVARPSDAFILQETFEQKVYKLLQIATGDVVLDVGAYIGTFARWALTCGAKSVYSYEPNPESFKLLNKNVHGHSVFTTWAAVVRGESQGVQTLYVNPEFGFSATLSADRGKKRTQKYEVPTMDFEEILHRVHPDVIKMDVEGSEYDLIGGDIPAYFRPRTFAVEYHYNVDGWWKKAREMDLALNAVGYLRSDHRKLMTKKTGWTTIALYRRSTP